MILSPDLPLRGDGESIGLKQTHLDARQYRQMPDTSDEASQKIVSHVSLKQEVMNDLSINKGINRMWLHPV